MRVLRTVFVVSCLIYCYSCNKNAVSGGKRKVVQTDILACGSIAYEISFYENDTLLRKGLYVGEDTSLPYLWHTFYSEKEIKMIEYFPPCLNNQFYKTYRNENFSHVNNIFRLVNGDTIVYPREGFCKLTIPSKKIYLGDTFFAYFDLEYGCFDTNFIGGFFSTPYDTSLVRIITPGYKDNIIPFSFIPSKVGKYVIECLIREDNMDSTDEVFIKTGEREVRDYYYNLDFEVFLR